MRTTLAQKIAAGLAICVLTGCTADNNGSRPSWAFWRASPFQSTPGATPGGVGSPEKPSQIASRGTQVSPADSTLGQPGNRLASNPNASGSALSGASGSYPNTQASFNAPVAYPTTNYPTTNSSYPSGGASTTAGTQYPTSNGGYAGGYSPTAGDTRSTIPPNRSGYGANTTSGYGANATGSGYGANTAGSGYGANTTSSGYGANTTGSGYGANATASGHGANTTGSGYGANTTGSGYGANAAGSGYGSNSAYTNPYATPNTTSNATLGPNPVRDGTSYPAIANRNTAWSGTSGTTGSPSSSVLPNSGSAGTGGAYPASNGLSPAVGGSNSPSTGTGYVPYGSSNSPSAYPSSYPAGNPLGRSGSLNSGIPSTNPLSTNNGSAASIANRPMPTIGSGTTVPTYRPGSVGDYRSLNTSPSTMPNTSSTIPPNNPSSTIPPMGSSSTIPPLGSSSTMPPLGGSSTIPPLGGSSTIPPNTSVPPSSYNPMP